MRIADGDKVVTTTLCAGGKDARGNKLSEHPNSQTGPFYVEGAEAGDTLSVRLDRLKPNREFGFSTFWIAPNVVSPSYVPKLPRPSWKPWPPAEWRVDAKKGTATLIKPETRLGAFEVPLAPMLGSFGVAPSGQQAISTVTAGRHGGNMDYRGFVSGVTVCFPVFVQGALFSLGDGHAAQGDGEISGTGIEISLDVEFTIRVHKGKRINWPLEQATQHATTEMLRWLQEDYDLDMVGANILMGQCVEYDLGNLFDPAYTMVCKISKSVLPVLGERGVARRT